MFIASWEEINKLDSCHINDTVCIDGPFAAASALARIIHEKYNVGIKLVCEGCPGEPFGQDVEFLNTSISQILGEGRAEAVKFSDGKVVGVCLVVLLDKQMPARAADSPGKEDSNGDLARITEEATGCALAKTRQALEGEIAREGGGKMIGFAGTNYCLPLAMALLGVKAETLNDCLLVLGDAEALAGNRPAGNGLYFDSADSLPNQGMAFMFCEEILAALSGAKEEGPVSGFIPDSGLRSLGLRLVDGRVSGVAVIMGAGEDPGSMDLVSAFQSKGIVSLLSGNAGQAFRGSFIIGLGSAPFSCVYAMNFIFRAPLVYGGIKPGDWKGALDYVKNHIPAFLLLCGPFDVFPAGFCLGALAFGIPVVSCTEVPGLPGNGTLPPYDKLTFEKDYSKLPSRCVTARGIKIKMRQADIPVPYSPAFEGERLTDQYIGFGGGDGFALELLSQADEARIEDGRVEVTGQDLDRLVQDGASVPLAIAVDVSGSRMQKDFEPVLERQINRFLNYAMGVVCEGRRSSLCLKVSRKAFMQGFRLKHIGVILHSMLRQEYGDIVEKAQVRIYTDSGEIEALKASAQGVFDERDRRLGGFSDEEADAFYSCTLCQSVAPGHVCMLTPERPGLCGAYSWLDAKVSAEINPCGPNQRVEKGNPLDIRLGQWDNVNSIVRQKSNNTIESLSLYSLMNAPQSACGYFECIAAVVPEANGVMIVRRDYSGPTPCGMDFTALAAFAGRGRQTPGFMGIGKQYITSRKFISAEGGLKRVVWMSKALKDELYGKLEEKSREAGYPGLVAQIADETTATVSSELLVFLREKEHPVLRMDALV